MAEKHVDSYKKMTEETKDVFMGLVPHEKV